MTVSSLPVWRSLLFVPVTARRFVDGAARRGADAIILDLEDSVAASEKERARTLVPALGNVVGQQSVTNSASILRPMTLDCFRIGRIDAHIDTALPASF